MHFKRLLHVMEASASILESMFISRQLAEFGMNNAQRQISGKIRRILTRLEKKRITNLGMSAMTSLRWTFYCKEDVKRGYYKSVTTLKGWHRNLHYSLSIKEGQREPLAELSLAISGCPWFPVPGPCIPVSCYLPGVLGPLLAEVILRCWVSCRFHFHY